jgi:prepilin-type N-terminal cleavage/methylation domain-containing protein
MINKFKQYNQGFTLIETLVAVLLLVVAIAGPLTVASRAFNSALVAKDQVTAYYLAQDALEYVRFRRDSRCLANGTAQACISAATPWLTFFGTSCNTTGCTVDTILTGNAPTTCNPTIATGCVINYDSTNRRYVHTGGTASKFKRYVQIASGVSAPTTKEALVTVTVSWPSPATTQAGCPTTNTRCVILKEYIFNWQ